MITRPAFTDLMRCAGEAQDVVYFVKRGVIKLGLAPTIPVTP